MKDPCFSVSLLLPSLSFLIISLSHSLSLSFSFFLSLSFSSFILLRPPPSPSSPFSLPSQQVINFYMCMLKERDTSLCEKDATRIPSYFFNSFFMFTLMIRDGKYDYNSVRRWTKKIDIFALDKVCTVLYVMHYRTRYTMLVLFLLLLYCIVNVVTNSYFSTLIPYITSAIFKNYLYCCPSDNPYYLIFAK